MTTTFKDYRSFFHAATGNEPYPYQERLGVDGLPEIMEVPTGAGKTAAAVLPWLWAQFGPEQERRARTPRRLLYVLPMRTLVNQTESNIGSWLEKLGLAEQVTVHALMGGRLSARSQNEWRLAMDKPSVIISTADCAISRLLMRGYGSSRGAYPIDFALLTNGTHIVLDEVQLMPQAVATARQVSGIRQSFTICEPVGMTCMSATIDRHALDVVDNRWPHDAVAFTLDDADRAAIAQRLQAPKTIRELTGVATPKELATKILEHHRAGTLTIAVVNTVDQAKDVYVALGKLSDQPKLLLHSRFRGVDKERKIEVLQRAHTDGEDLVVISTQVIEAGIDIDAATLVTEAAPWPSLCQRAGRLNRAGVRDESHLFWFAPFTKAQPYPAEDLEATANQLRSLEGQTLPAASLLDMPVQTTKAQLRFLRRRDLISLFDTTPDLAGNDLDISPYIRDSEDLDIYVAWLDAGLLTEHGDLQAKVPPEPLRCAVRPRDLRAFLARKPKAGEAATGVRAWRFSPHDNRFIRLSSATPVRPNDFIIIDSSSGGYDTEIGFTPESRAAVDTPELAQRSVPDGPEADTEAGSIDQGDWLTLEQHLNDAAEEAGSLLRALDSLHDQELSTSIEAAAALHDLGKAFPDWQQALLDVHDAKYHPQHEDIWAKSPAKKDDAGNIVRGSYLRVRRGGKRQRKAFRHELASVLYLMSPAGKALMSQLGVPESRQPLVLYLIGAHHGHLRMQPRDPMTEGVDGRSLLGIFDAETMPEFRWQNRRLGGHAVDLSRFGSGDGSWSNAAQELLTEFGPFMLAYLETVVRMADWRASDRPGTTQGSEDAA